MVGDSEFLLQINPQRMMEVLYGVRGTRHLQSSERGAMMGGRGHSALLVILAGSPTYYLLTPGLCHCRESTLSARGCSQGAAVPI